MYNVSQYNYYIFNSNNDLLIMNTRTQNKVKICHQYGEIIKTFTQNHGDFEIKSNFMDDMQFFINRGFIISSDFDEYKWVELKQNEMIYGSDALSVEIMPTDDCNFRCTYCFERNANNYMDSDTEDRVIKFFEREVPKCKQLRLAWFGGEPLLCVEQIIRMSKRIAEICKKNKVPMFGEMSTNGYCLTSSIMKELIKNHITKFQICIDGTRKYHNLSRPHYKDADSYSKIISNLLDIKNNVHMGSYQVFVRTNVTLNDLNCIEEHIKEMKCLFGDNKRFSFTFQCVRDWGGDRIDFNQIIKSEGEIYDKLYSMTTKYEINSAASISFTPINGNCEACRKNGYLIDYAGNLHKCSLAYHSKEYNNINHIGYIDKNGGIHVDENKLAKWIVNSPNVDEKCIKCVLFPFCLGGHCAFVRNIQKKITCNKDIFAYLKQHLLQLDYYKCVEVWDKTKSV